MQHVIMSPPSWVFPTVAASTWLGELPNHPRRRDQLVNTGFSDAAGYAGPLDYDR